MIRLVKVTLLLLSVLVSVPVAFVQLEKSSCNVPHAVLVPGRAGDEKTPPLVSFMFNEIGAPGVIVAGPASE
jgi:hypothetical protein